MRWLLPALVVACTLPFEPIEPHEPITDPGELAIYNQWYEEVAACMGRQGRPERVRWLVVDAPSGMSCDRAAGCGGYWAPPRTIYLASGTGRWQKEVVQHEAVHDILGSGSHSFQAFTTCVSTGG